MPKTITIKHVTRIEGHARISIHLDDSGKVSSTRFHVTQVRGFEKFVEGRPYYEMPSITARICGICPVSHLLASVKACDAIMAVQVPETALKLRELLHCGQFVQSHALSFFHLSSPDLLLGMDSDPAKRNVIGVLEKFPELARSGIVLRKFGQQVIERLAKERVHPSWTVPGGVNAPLSQDHRDAILSELPVAKAIVRHTLKFFKGAIENFTEEIETFGNAPTMYAGMTDAAGNLQLYDGQVRFRDADANLVAVIESRPTTRPSSARPWSRIPTSRRPTTSPSVIPRASTAWDRSPGSTWPTAAERRKPTPNWASSASASDARPRAPSCTTTPG